MPAERALLVTVQFDPRFARVGAWTIDDEAAELRELARGAGCQVVDEASAKRHEPVAATLLGSGKLEELAQRARAARANLIVFSQELSPAQQRNIEQELGAKTIDRTQLILDVFAQRARSQEGKVQVELAQLRYLLPRLVGKGILLSRLGGGIGTRGPGEQKLEMDRRRIRTRLGRLGDELKQLARRREATRARRHEADVPVVALVGYTNAGKTTLLNRLSGAGAATRDQLFTTLDPLARRARLPGGEPVILTDTVGFLHQLPHHLIEAFHATLEEARGADLLLHVLDMSHPRVDDHARAVAAVLGELGLEDKPLVTALNKRDLLQGRPLAAAELRALEQAYAPAAAISAKTGEGLDALGALISARLGMTREPPTKLRIPAERSDALALLYRAGQVVSRREHDGVVDVAARLSGPVRAALAQYILPT